MPPPRTMSLHHSHVLRAAFARRHKTRNQGKPGQAKKDPKQPSNKCPALSTLKSDKCTHILRYNKPDVIGWIILRFPLPTCQKLDAGSLFFLFGRPRLYWLETPVCGADGGPQPHLYPYPIPQCSGKYGAKNHSVNYFLRITQKVPRTCFGVCALTATPYRLLWRHNAVEMRPLEAWFVMSESCHAEDMLDESTLTLRERVTLQNEFLRKNP